MFDSVRNWLGRRGQHQAAADQLAAEAKDFRIPSEILPQIFKYFFFAGLAVLNFRLFSHAVPGVWGKATGVVAVLAEATALYALHYFSRSAGLFRLSLGAAGVLLMAFSLIHGSASIFDLIGVAELSASVQYYSRVVAFPLLAGLVGLSVVAITMSHPKNLIRLKQAAAHTRIAVGRAEAASELELMRAQGVLDRARRDRHRERTRLEEEELIDLQRIIAVEERKAQLVASIGNPQLREAMARELGIDLKAQGSQAHTSANLVNQASLSPGQPANGHTSGNNRVQFRAGALD
jgi:hypothetical protein